jgi:hypothetical protein
MSQAVLESLRDSRKIFLDVTISAFLKAMFDKPISQAQATRLWTIARVELKLQDCEIRAGKSRIWIHFDQANSCGSIRKHNAAT